MEEGKPTAFTESVVWVQMKAIAATVRGLLEEALKDHVGAMQLETP